MGKNQETTKLESEKGQVKKDGIQEMIDRAMLSYERLPMLEIVFDRFARTLSTSLRNLTSENVEIDVGNMSSLRFGDYMSSVPTPCLLAIFKVIEWEDYGLVMIDSKIIYAILDMLFGGRKNRSAKVENRSYTKIELGIIRQLADIILNDLGSSFDDLSPATFQFDRIETNPKFATISRVGDAAILLKMKVELDGTDEGNIEILLPYATLEPIKPLLLQVYMGEKIGKDSSWESLLESEIYKTNIELESVLHQKEGSMEDILKLKVGSTISFDMGPDDDVFLKCAGTDMFSGKLGRLGQKVAVSITQTINKKIKEEFL